jgi:ABC-type polysaccharide/polyol phosphate export permease
MFKRLRELYDYRDLILNLAVTELKLRYRDSLLGFLWTVLNPLFFLLILALVFSQIIRFSIPHYTIFLFAGLASWLMIQQTVTIATASIVNNQALIRKVYVPKMAFPVSNVLARYVDHGILIALLIILAIVLKTPLTLSLLFLPVAVVLHLVFSLGLSLLFAVAYIRVRDTQHIVAIVFQALFYVTPVLYSLDILPVRYRGLFLWNPFYYFVQLVRYPVYFGTLPKFGDFAVGLGLAAGTLLVGGFIFLRKEKYFVFHLS